MLGGGLFVEVSAQMSPRAGNTEHLVSKEPFDEEKRLHVFVPVTALIFRSKGLQVSVVREGLDGPTAEVVPITQGRDYGTEVEVTYGITPADSVIVNRPDSLTSGMRVRVASGQDAPK